MKWAYLKKYALYLTDTDLNKLGKDHWELIGFDGGSAYFKRPVQSALPSKEKAEPVPTLDTVLTYQGRAIEIFSKPYHIEIFSKPYHEPSSTIDKVYRYQVEGLPEGFWLPSAEQAIDTAKSAIDEAIAVQASE